jgi:isoquinoline 1-oxidoreductase beta subunit
VTSILDELAHAGQVDPVALRLSHLGEAASFPYEGDNPAPYKPERLKHVLRLAAEKSGWGTPLPQGRARGIAVHYTFGSYAAEVAEVSVDAQKRIRVHRVVAAIDVGLPVNPLNLEAQTQGGIIDGLSAAMFGEITIARGRTVQSTFEDHPLLRNRDAPEIELTSSPAASTRPASARSRCCRSRPRWRTRSSL